MSMTTTMMTAMNTGMTMLDDFLIRATLAGIAVAVAAAPLGCFVVWRRMAYFGDATAHAAVLGVAASLAFSMSVTLGVLCVAVLMTLLIGKLSDKGYAIDTILGVMAHSALAIGLVAVSLIDGIRIDIMAYLFGDILTVGRTDLAQVWIGAAVILGVVIWRWSPLLTSTLNPDLARASGIDPKREEMFLTLSIAIMVAVAIKIIGALLITALLIIPAASARPLSKGPEAMALIAALLAIVAVLGGVQSSMLFDTPTGPSIVCAATLIFVVTNLAAKLKG